MEQKFNYSKQYGYLIGRKNRLYTEEIKELSETSVNVYIF